jgi:hypothetical protein
LWSERNGPDGQGPSHDAALADGRLQVVGRGARRRLEAHIEDRRLGGRFGPPIDPGDGAARPGGDAHRLQHRTHRELAGVAFQVVDAVAARVERVHADPIVAEDVEAPGLAVVAAGCPAGEVEDVERQAHWKCQGAPRSRPNAGAPFAKEHLKLPPKNENYYHPPGRARPPDASDPW